MGRGVHHQVSHDANIVQAAIDFDGIVMKVRRVVAMEIDGDVLPVCSEQPVTHVTGMNPRSPGGRILTERDRFKEGLAADCPP